MIDNIERSELIDLLERATATLQARPDQRRPDELETDADWTALVRRILKLPISYSAAVQAALVQGRWRSAKHPSAYLRTVAEIRPNRKR